MTTLQLRDRLNALIEEMPNTANDEINYLNGFDLLPVEEVDIAFDIYTEDERYVVIQ